MNDVFQASFRSRYIKQDKLYYYINGCDISDNDLIDKDYIKYEFEENNKMIVENSKNKEFNNIPKWYYNLLVDLSYQIKINKYYYVSSFNHFLKITGHKNHGLLLDEFYIDRFDNMNDIYETIEERKMLKNFNNVYEQKDILYNIDYLLKNDENMKEKFIDHIQRFINKYNNINIDNQIIINEEYNIQYYINNNIIPEYYIDQYRRFLITYEQKNNNDNTDIKKYIKNLIDMKNIILNYDDIKNDIDMKIRNNNIKNNHNNKNDEEFINILVELFTLYNDKHKRHIFKNIIYYDSYTPQEYQEIHNNNYKLGKNIELIKNVGKSLEISKELCKIFNINNPYTNNLNIKYKNFNNAIKYIKDNKKTIELIFNIKINDDSNYIIIISNIFKKLYNTSFKLMKNYNGRTKDEDKEYQFVNILFNDVKLKSIKKNNINSKLLDDGTTDLFNDD